MTDYKGRILQFPSFESPNQTGSFSGSFKLGVRETSGLYVYFVASFSATVAAGGVITAALSFEGNYLASGAASQPNSAKVITSTSLPPEVDQIIGLSTTVSVGAGSTQYPFGESGDIWGTYGIDAIWIASITGFVAADGILYLTLTVSASDPVT